MTVRRAFTVVSLGLTLALWASSVFAEAPAASPSELARLGLTRYGEARYDEAAALFLQAYALSGRSGQLWNAAKALAKADRRAEALERYRQFRALPDLRESERDEADAEIGRLESELDAPTSPPPPLVVPPPPLAISAPAATTEPPVIEAARPTSSPAWPVWVAFGGATVATAVGVPLLIDSQNRQDRLEAALGQVDGGLIVGIERGEALDEEGGVRTERIVGAALLGVAAAAVTVGLVAWLSGD